MIEGVEEFFLCTFFSDDELYVVDQQYVVIAVLVAEKSHGGFVIRSLTFFQSFDQLVGKGLACYVQYFLFRILVQDEMRDRMHQMRLSKTYVSIKKKRIVDFPR